MALPSLPGWLIDYVAAANILNGQSRKAKNAVRAMCASGVLKYCFSEEKTFKGDVTVRGPFYDVQKCKCPFDLEIVGAMDAFPDKLGSKPFNAQDHTSRMIVASAIYYNFGIISAKDGMFVTPIELGQHHGITCLNVAQFISLC